MSTLDDAIAAGRRDVDALTCLRDRYPSAERIFLPDGRPAWGNSTIEPSGFKVCVVPDENGFGHLGEVWLCPFERIDDTVVFALKPAWIDAGDFFDRLSRRDAATFQKLLQNFGP